MQLNEELSSGSYISNYAKGMITISGVDYHQNIIITPAGVVTPWSISNLAQLNTEKCQELVDFKPEIILLGTGERSQLPDLQIVKFFMQHKIGVEMMSTAAACRTYNILLAENRKVLAGLIV